MIHIEWEPEVDDVPSMNQVSRTKDNPLRNRICNVPETESEFFHRWLSRQKEGCTDYEDSAAERHAGKSGSWRTSYDTKRYALDLRLLRVCRHIYCECRLTTYAENAFAFEELETFRHFILLTTMDQRRCIRSLSFGLNIKRYAQGSMLDAITAKHTEHLENLRTINICLHLDLWDPQHSEQIREAGIVAFLMAVGFYKFALVADRKGRGSLKGATVMVSEAARPDDGEPLYSDTRSGIPASILAEQLPELFEWTSDERRSQAQAARAKFLDSNDISSFTGAQIRACEKLKVDMLDDSARQALHDSDGFSDD